MTAPQLEHSLVRSGLDDVNDSRCILLLAETLQNHKVAHRLLILDQVVGLRVCFHHQWVCGLADLTLELFPGVGYEVFFLFLGHLLL